MADLLKTAFKLLVGSDEVALPKHTPRPAQPSLRGLNERELIQRESEIGAQLFGPVPDGHERSFFNLDAATWIWYEAWTDRVGKRRSTTTRYEVHDNGILKVQEGARYSFLEGEERDNLMLAIRMYYDRVSKEIYGRDPSTGRRLA